MGKCKEMTDAYPGNTPQPPPTGTNKREEHTQQTVILADNYFLQKREVRIPQQQHSTEQQQ